MSRQVGFRGLASEWLRRRLGLASWGHRTARMTLCIVTLECLFGCGGGGDGAFHHMVEGAFGADVNIGFFPAGNGNDIAAALGIPRDPIEAVHAFLKSQPRRVDVIRVRFADVNPTSQAMYIGAGGTKRKHDPECYG